LTSILLTTLLGTSQVVTANDSLICLPKRTLQQVIKDLEYGDLATKELDLTHEINMRLQSIITVQDSIITVYKNKESMYDTEIILLNRKLDVNDTQLQLYQDRLNQYKTERNIAIGTGAGIIIAMLTVILTR